MNIYFICFHKVKNESRGYNKSRFYYHNLYDPYIATKWA
jgi:hypothetical protein